MSNKYQSDTNERKLTEQYPRQLPATLLIVSGVLYRIVAVPDCIVSFLAPGTNYILFSYYLERFL